MPITWTVDLASVPDPNHANHYDQLHRAACRFFEPDGTNHDAADKPFAIRLLPAGDGDGARVTYTWLPDTPPPHREPPRSIRLGGTELAAASARTTPVPYGRLAAGAPLRRAVLTVRTPAKFRHHSRDYPLPDPYITFSSLARNYLRHRPAAATTDEVGMLARAVVIYRHDIHTERFTWHGRDSAGFVGLVEFGIPRSTGEALWRLFGTLCRFAALAGLGHGTTHGLGATDLNPGDRAT